MKLLLIAATAVAILGVLFLGWIANACLKIAARFARQENDACEMAAHYKRQLEQQAIIASNTQAELGEAVTLWRRCQQKHQEVA